MDSQPENFENLRRLLALKRHEQPPPGYFDSFSREVFLRLQAGESDQQVGWERMGWEAPWLQRFWEALSLKPFLTGAIGVVACALVLAGVLYAERLNLPAEDGQAQTPLSLPSDAPAIAFNQFPAQSDFTAVTNSSFEPTLPAGLFGPPSINPPRASRPFGGN